VAGREFREGESCVICGTTEGKTLGRGACSACYQKERRKHLKENGLDSEPVSTVSFETIPDDEFQEQFETEESVPGLMSNPSASQEQISQPSSNESLTDKAKNFLGFGAPKEKTNKPLFQTNEATPGLKNKRRESAAGIISDTFNGLGGLISRNSRHRPSGILLQWQSDAAGEIIDEAVKDTFIDKLFLQKAVKGKGKLDQVGAILIPPAIVFAIEMNPERLPQLAPLLESSLRNSLPQMAKGIKKARKKKEDNDKAIAELFPELEPGEDPIQILMSEMFSGWYSSGEQTQQETGEFSDV